MTEIEANLIEAGQDVEVGLMRPQDAPGVAALFRTVYGQGYPVKTYYDPQALIQANQNGEIISAVARTPKGDIVGHNAMYRIAPCPKVYEGGAAMVLPAYRNTAKLFSRMVATGIQAVPVFGGEGVYGEHVCNHLFTQKTAVSLGNITMGLEPDLMPAQAYEQEQSASGRVSSLFGYQSLAAHPHTVYLPPVYAEGLRFIYEGLLEQRSLESASLERPAQPASRLAMEVYDFAQVSRITAWELGADLAQALEPLERQADAQGVAVRQIWLPLARPQVGWAVEALRAKGYFLGGLLPRWFDEDGLLMQRLAHAPDWDGMQILTERAKRIVELVKEDWQRVGGRAPRLP